jgi:hypothetical protein
MFVTPIDTAVASLLTLDLWFSVLKPKVTATNDFMQEIKYLAINIHYPFIKGACFKLSSYHDLINNQPKWA